jgi:hypothetical protein
VGAIESVTAWGLPRAAEVVELAAAERLDLAAACTMLEKESGGRNVWGSDGVSTGGFYVKGAAVTRAAYEAWKPHRSRLGSQGVGPAQLTYGPLQDQADALGGCWDWRHNVRIGFRHLAALQRSYGVRDGFRRYNGSGAAAERYAADAMTRHGRWRDRLGTSAPARPAPPPAPPTAVEVDDMFTEDDRRALRVVHDELTKRHPTRVDFGLLGETPPAVPFEATAAGFAVSADARAYEAREVALDVERRVAELRELVAAALARPAAGITADEVRALFRSALAELGPLFLTMKEIP